MWSRCRPTTEASSGQSAVSLMQSSVTLSPALGIGARLHTVADRPTGTRTETMRLRGMDDRG